MTAFRTGRGWLAGCSSGPLLARPPLIVTFRTRAMALGRDRGGGYSISPRQTLTSVGMSMCEGSSEGELPWRLAERLG